MRRILGIFLIIVILFLIFFWQVNNNPAIIIANLNNKGGIREGDLKYRINLLGLIPIGEATFNLEKLEEYNGLKVYHLHANTNSLDYYATLFKGYASVDSYVDTRDSNPVLFKQRIEAPGNENPYKEVFYEQKKGIMSVDGVKRQIFPNTQDPLSAMFNLKHMDFDKVDNFEININTNQKNYILEGTANHKELRINNKIYKIVLAEAEIRRRDKNPYHKSHVSMTLLRGENNLPVLIKVFASGILINAKLAEIK